MIQILHKVVEANQPYVSQINRLVSAQPSIRSLISPSSSSSTEEGGGEIPPRHQQEMKRKESGIPCLPARSFPPLPSTVPRSPSRLSHRSGGDRRIIAKVVASSCRGSCGPMVDRAEAIVTRDDKKLS